MRFDEVLMTFTRELERLNLRYAVIGGLALQALGLSRFTRDIDLVVENSGRDAVISFAESLGYETLHASEGYSNHLHADETMGRIDFMYVDHATAGKLFNAASMKPIVGDVVAPVASPEHLLAMKALAMKNAPRRVLTDSADVQFLLALPGVDRTAVRDYFSRHGMLDLFDAIERKR